VTKSAARNRPLIVRRLGRVEYSDALALMAALREARGRGAIDDTLLLLEHPAVITLGRKGRREHLLASDEVLEGRGIEVVETERGGDITYHGPGQVVGYPIIDLSPDRRDVRRYVRDLEEAMILAAADHGVAAGRLSGMNGIWLGREADPASNGESRKLGAVGVHISRWITTHGFAFNANTDLADFELILPCGIRGRGVTSLAEELGARVDVAEVERRLAARLAERLGREAIEVKSETETVQVQVVRASAAGPRVLALRRNEARGGFWQPVTGKVEGGESVLEAATRELREETGLAGAPLPLTYRHAFLWPREGHPTVAEETAFVALAPEGFSPRLSPAEHDEARWMSPEEAVAHFPHAGLKRAVRLACESEPSA
jgi:lipoyl(octanoyl) transferase